MPVNCKNCDVYLCEYNFIEETEKKDKYIINTYFCSSNCQTEYTKQMKVQFILITKKEPVEDLKSKILELESKLQLLENSFNSLQAFAKNECVPESVVIKAPRCGCGDCPLCSGQY